MLFFFSQQFWEISLRCRISTKSHIWAWAVCYLTRSQPAMVPVVVPVEARVEPGKSGQWVTFTLRTSKTMGWLVVYLPLWKIWVCQLGLWISQYMESHKIPWFQTTNQMWIFIMDNYIFFEMNPKWSFKRCWGNNFHSSVHIFFFSPLHPTHFTTKWLVLHHHSCMLSSSMFFAIYIYIHTYIYIYVYIII